MLRCLLFGFLVAIAPAAIGAAPILSQTTYLCSAGLDCPIPTTVAGPAPVDPDALEGSNTTTPLAPGASIAGAHNDPLAQLASFATATAVGPAPPRLQLRVEDGDLTGDQAVIAHLYWQDTLTIDAASLADFTTLTWTPVLNFDGVMDLFADSLAAGGIEWSFNIAVNTNTFFGAGGFCQPGFATGAVDCSANNGFGPSFPTSTFVLDNLAFEVEAGAVLRIQGPNISTGLLGMAETTIDWLGVQVGDVGGTPVGDFTVTSASGIDYTLASVPEPSTALLIAVGLVGLAAHRVRRLRG